MLPLFKKHFLVMTKTGWCTTNTMKIYLNNHFILNTILAFLPSSKICCTFLTWKLTLPFTDEILTYTVQIYFILFLESLLHAWSHTLCTSFYNLSYDYNLYIILNTATTEQLFTIYREKLRWKCYIKVTLLKFYSESVILTT